MLQSDKILTCCRTLRKCRKSQNDLIKRIKRQERIQTCAYVCVLGGKRHRRKMKQKTWIRNKTEQFRCVGTILGGGVHLAAFVKSAWWIALGASHRRRCRCLILGDACVCVAPISQAIHGWYALF
ncbi:hypothetical protein GWI33_020993 [Rhynchophorus ferrugineus]|uniref:Uncharacterized protein n=1 Tax=Rhynchophorus ferrugineus TaxID=354439 RepID=A0A834M3P0_RHYFE|nr:hypothetical protein GWI33_020993 [Rhynchophorus ferrugineus]